MSERSELRRAEWGGAGGLWAQVRIYALPEVAGIYAAAPQTILEARFQEGLRNCCAWAQAGRISCAICDRVLEGHASYLAVLIPMDEACGLGLSSAVCVECGKAPRSEVLTRVQQAALLMFGPEMGHA